MDCGHVLRVIAVTWLQVLAQAASAASPGAGDNLRRAADAANAAANAAADAVRGLRVPDMAVLDVDIKKSVTLNFLVQLVLTGVSWAIAFFTSHATMAKVRYIATSRLALGERLSMPVPTQLSGVCLDHLHVCCAASCS